MQQVVRIPFDLDSIELGDIIPQESIAKLIDHPIGSSKYQFEMMALQSRLEKDLTVIYGREIFVCQHKGGLRVLADEDRAAYTQQMDEKRLRNMKRSVRILASTDTASFTTDQRQQYERQLEIQTRLLASDLKTRKQYRIDHQKPKSLTQGDSK